MLSPLSKALAVCVVAIALGLMANGARAESYPSDAPNAGVPEAKAKPAKVKIRHVPQLVVHPQITSKKSGK
jgi:hypothetical protein